MIGIWQLVLIFAIILILFGAGKIPTIMKDLGSGLRAFKKGIDGDENSEVDLTNDIDVEKNVKRLINSGKKIQKTQKNAADLKIKNKSNNKNIKNSKKIVKNSKEKKINVSKIKKDNVKTQKAKVRSKKINKTNSKKK